MKKQQFFTLLALVMLFLSLPIVSLAQEGELEVTEISLGFGVDPVFAPHIIALEMGWFEDAGFTNVETATFTAGALAGEALAAGEIELWTPGNVPPISMRHNGMPIVIVGTNTLAYIEKFVARSDATLESPEDLLNIRIGLLEGSTASAVVENIANHYEIDPLELQIVNLPPPEQLTSIINDDIQAFVVWNPWPYLAEQNEEVDVEILHTGTESNFAWDEDGEFQASFTRSVWVMSEDFIRNNPNTAAALMDVMHRAQDYVNDPDNQEEVIEIVATFLDQPIEQVEALWGDYTFESVFDDVYEADMQTYTDFLFEAGRIDDPQDPMSYTYTAFMETHNPDNVVVEGTWEP